MLYKNRARPSVRPFVTKLLKGFRKIRYRYCLQKFCKHLCFLKIDLVTVTNDIKALWYFVCTFSYPICINLGAENVCKNLLSDCEFRKKSKQLLRA